MLIAILTALVAACSELLSGDVAPRADLAPSTLNDFGDAFAATFYAFEGVGLVLPIGNQYFGRGGDRAVSDRAVHSGGVGGGWWKGSYSGTHGGRDGDECERCDECGAGGDCAGGGGGAANGFRSK